MFPGELLRPEAEYEMKPKGEAHKEWNSYAGLLRRFKTSLKGRMTESYLWLAHASKHGPQHHTAL